MNIPKFISTKTVIINLFNKDTKECLSVKRLQDFLSYVYIELYKRNKLCDYQMSFDVSTERIERTVAYNCDIFALDKNCEVIYLRNPDKINILAKECPFDDIMDCITQSFSEVVE